MMEDIKKQFKEVLEYSQRIKVSDQYIDNIFNQWYSNKKDFIDAFDGELIYESPYEVSFDVNLSLKITNYESFCKEISICYCTNTNLINFLQSYDAEDFYQNSLSHDYNGNGVTIKKGAKFLKALKHFVKDPKALEMIQNHASQLIQEGKVTGIFCMSVHPLDYLSISENNYHWRSCHSLDGDYRVGNIAYMMDSSTIICYIKSKNGNVQLNRFGSVEWNNKKWRMLLFFSTERNCIFAGRQYPFTINDILERLTTELYFSKPLMKIGDNNGKCRYICWSKWSNYQLTSVNNSKLANPYILMDGNLYNLSNIIDHGGNEAPTYYNDLLYSTCYTPYYCYNYWADISPSKVKFCIGADVPCADCGEYVDISSSFICSNCIDEDNDDSEGYWCEDCGTWIPYDDVTFVNGVPLCPNCVVEDTLVCEECGEICFKEDIIYLDDTKKYVCKWCAHKEDNE